MLDVELCCVAVGDTKTCTDYVLKLEDELRCFVMAKESKPHIVLPPRSSYQRLVAYRLALRFKLQKPTPVQEREAIATTGNGGNFFSFSWL